MKRLIPILLLVAIICAAIPLLTLVGGKLTYYNNYKIAQIYDILYKLALFITIPSTVYYIWIKHWKYLTLLLIVGIPLISILKILTLILLTIYEII